MHFVRLVFCLTFSCLFAMYQAPTTVVDEPAMFRIHPEINHQTLAGFGAGMFQGTMADLKELPPTEINRLYDLIYGTSGLALNIIRLHISFAAQPLSPDDPLQSKGLHYDWGKDEFTQEVWKAVDLALRHAHDPILYAVPFTPPPRWKTNHQPVFGGSVPAEDYRDYAEYLADFLVYYKVVHGVDIKVLSVQNEPDISVYWESCRWTGEELRDFLKILGPVLAARDLQTQIMMPEGSTWDESWNHAEPALMDPISRQYISILAAHTYGDFDLVDQSRKLLSNAARQNHVTLWMSETSIIGPPDDPSMLAGLQIAHRIYRDLVQGDASAWIYCFVIFTSKFSGSMGVLSPVKDGHETIPKRFWTMANYSHFVKPGWQRIEVDGISFANSAFRSPAGDEFAIVGLNATVNARPATYEFGNYHLSEVRAFRTSQQTDLSQVERPEIDSTRFRATLSPFSVTTFIGKLSPVEASH